ncbi:hypothetical protein AB0B25_11190 [Nocardia sp. NPDC049190]|uniref:hypothetical protein n=1 Tax=Nocardia sp. NPDC049190 TaxID=3155650 RepID=UPI0034055B3D
MTSRLDLALPNPGETLSLGELRLFVKQAFTGGATADTPVTVVPVQNADEIAHVLRVEFGAPPGPGRVKREDLDELLSLLSEIERNHGDARTQLRAVHDIRQRLTGRKG